MSKSAEGLGYLLDVRLGVVVPGEVVVGERAESRVLGEARSHSRSLVLPLPPPLKNQKNHKKKKLMLIWVIFSEEEMMITKQQIQISYR